jgi:four helix bundle protein
MTQQELTDRLLRFAINILSVTERMIDTPESNALRAQIVRSGTAPALLYGEACAAESPKDFVHKMGIGLKELRETRMTLTIISAKNYAMDISLMELIDENDQMIKIFGSSINTVRQKHIRKR